MIGPTAPPEHGGEGIAFPGSSVPGSAACVQCPPAQYAQLLEERWHLHEPKMFAARRHVKQAELALEQLRLSKSQQVALAAVRAALGVLH